MYLFNSTVALDDKVRVIGIPEDGSDPYIVNGIYSVVAFNKFDHSTVSVVGETTGRTDYRCWISADAFLNPPVKPGDLVLGVTAGSNGFNVWLYEVVVNNGDHLICNSQTSTGEVARDIPIRVWTTFTKDSYFNAVRHANFFRTAANERHNAFVKYRNDVEHDFDVIDSRLTSEATNRGWCSEYDDIVDELNNKFVTSLRLTPLAQDFEVEVQITGTITTNHIITVNARSQEDANAIVMDTNDYRDDMNEILENAVHYKYFDDISFELN